MGRGGGLFFFFCDPRDTRIPKQTTVLCSGAFFRLPFQELHCVKEKHINVGGFLVIRLPKKNVCFIL